jgi:hypothetical protein
MRNVIKIIFGEKDTMVVHRDMEEVGIQPQLWLQQLENGSYIKPNAPYVLTKEEKRTFLQIIKHLKTPTHYVATLHTRVARDGKLKGLKSHDYHVMMQ